MESFQKSKTNRKLSQLVQSNSSFKGDSLELNFKEISVLDAVPAPFHRIARLNLSYNRLASLSGIEQFKDLTHLVISDNQISDINELTKVKSSRELLVLDIQRNPCANHPDLTAISLRLFRRLMELNNFKITPAIKEDLKDSIILSQKLFPYFCKTEEVLRKLEQDLKLLRIKLEMFRYLKYKGKIDSSTGPYWEDVNAIHSKLLRNTKDFPRIHSSNKVRPKFILKFIDSVEEFVDYAQVENSNKRLFEWLFCEILLHEQSWGDPSLQNFLHSENHGTVQELFKHELEKFAELVYEPEDRARPTCDIFPRLNNNYLQKSTDFSSALSRNLFPIFANNPQYLKALMCILENQLNSLCDVNEEYKDLLRFDTSGLLPSIAENRPFVHSVARECSPATNISPSIYSEYTERSPFKSATSYTRASEDFLTVSRDMSDRHREEEDPRLFTFSRIPKENSIKDILYSHVKKNYSSKILKRSLQAWKCFIAHAKENNFYCVNKVFDSWRTLTRNSEKSRNFRLKHLTKRPFAALNLNKWKKKKEKVVLKDANTSISENMLYECFDERKTIKDAIVNEISKITVKRKENSENRKSKRELKKDATKLAVKIRRSQRCLDALWNSVKDSKKRCRSKERKCEECKLEDAKNLSRQISDLKREIKYHKNNKRNK